MTFIAPAMEVFSNPTGSMFPGPRHAAWTRFPTRLRNGKLMVKFEYFRENVPNREVLS